ncbi:DUF5998 family protein [Micrococcus sp.]|uniref:DUF5998 family protein n=1 Tax=Micrococcus sp. TaxID=1271 RepID=UPI002A91069E|nr:DUF5998 family protein [Micrococcus sp.]MDY6055518.1 DUF5998 family protein [Micrococcus sp.]
MSPLRRNHPTGPHDDGRSGAGHARAVGAPGADAPGADASLGRSLVHAGYYPELVAHTIAQELEGRPVDAHLVHVDTHFEYDEIHRHITVLVLAGDVLLAVHLDDHAADPAGQAVLAQVSTEIVPVRALGAVVLTTGHARPERFRPTDPVAEITLGVQWAGGRRLDLQPAGCADPSCDADHGYTGTSTREDLVIRVAADADGQGAVDAALGFARALRRAHVAATA